LAQNEDVSGYFDDNGLGNPRNVFKLDILQTLGGDVTIGYERFISDAFSLEVAGGFLLGRGVSPVFQSIDGNGEFFESRDGGYKIVITPLFHPSQDVFSGAVYGAQFFTRSVNGLEIGDSTVDRQDTYIAYYQGYRFEIGTRFSLEAAFTAGLLVSEFEGNTPNNDFLEGSDFNMSLSLKLGFHK
jgi:hypothetical protein